VNQTLDFASLWTLSDDGRTDWTKSATFPSWLERPGTRTIFRRRSQLEAVGAFCWAETARFKVNADKMMIKAVFLI
jgi:hypothetical protein